MKNKVIQIQTEGRKTEIKYVGDIEYIVSGVSIKTGTSGQTKVIDMTVKGRSPHEALGIATRRGRFGLGKYWRLTRQPDGWILAVNTAGRTLERSALKLREKNYTRGMR